MTAKQRSTPMRSCVVCRQKQPKTSLMRIVVAQDSLQYDPSGKMSGRGAYLCHQSQCWHRAAESNVLAQALHKPLQPSDRDYLRRVSP
jgi:predicted RNA-binding protein YlxR (DUF448 family)